MKTYWFQFYTLVLFFKQLCVERCKRHKMRYAGLLKGAWCQCSDGYNDRGVTTGCNIKCSGDLYEDCGGANKISAYEILPSLWNNTVIGMFSFYTLNSIVFLFTLCDPVHLLTFMLISKETN